MQILTSPSYPSPLGEEGRVYELFSSCVVTYFSTRILMCIIEGYDQSKSPFRGTQGVYSHSIVAGGLLLISYTTRLIPFTLLMISLLTWAKKS